MGIGKRLGVARRFGNGRTQGNKHAEWTGWAVGAALMLAPAGAGAQEQAPTALDKIEVTTEAKPAKPKAPKKAKAVQPIQPKQPQAPEPQAANTGLPVDAPATTSTASKRPQDRLDVPAGIGVVTGEELATRNMASISDLDRVFPDVNIRSRSTRAYTNITVRGQSAVDFYNPTVGIYIDGLPQDQISFAQLLPLGLEQAELLYGPQGTLFGRNTVGGVLNITTRKPGNEAHFESLATVSGLERGAAVLASAPIVKNVLYGDVALGYRAEDGEYVDMATMADIGDTKDRSGRVRLRYAPTGGPVDIMLMAGRSEIESDEERLVQQPFIKRRLAFPLPSHYTLETDSFGVTASYDLGFAKVSSLTGYQDRKFDRTVFGDYTPEDQETFNQEFTLASDLRLKNPIDYVFGLYFQNIDFERRTPFHFQTTSQTIDSYAAYGEVTWHVTDRFDVTPGLRYDYEVADGGGVGVNTFDVEKTSEAWSPKIALSYKLSEPWRVYGLYSTGFKPGGIVRSVTPGLTSVTYDPQLTDNFEVGTKYRSRDGRIELWAAAYYNVSDDYQLSVGPVTGKYIRNAGEVESKGINLTAKVEPWENFRVTAGLGLNDSTFTKYSNPDVPTQNFTGNTLPYAPEVTANANFEYAVPLGYGLGFAVPHFGVTYLSEIYFDESNTIGQGGYTLLDAGLTWKPSDNVSAEIFVENITDEIYTTYGFDAGFPIGPVYQLGQGRTAGASLRITY